MAIGTAAIKDLAWAAGLFEGEGSILVPSQRASNKTIRLSICSTDADVIQRFHEIIGLGRQYDYVPKNSLGKKRQYWWVISGHEKVQAVLAVFWGWLGERRKSKAVEALQKGASQRLPNEYIKLLPWKCGHEKTSENTYRYPEGREGCRPCRNAYSARYYQSHKVA